MDATQFQVKSYMASLGTQENVNLLRSTTSAPGAVAVQGIHSQDYLEELQAANGSGPLRSAISSPLPGTAVAYWGTPTAAVEAQQYEDEPDDNDDDDDGMVPHALEAQLAPDEDEVAARMAEQLERRMTQVLKQEVQQQLDSHRRSQAVVSAVALRNEDHLEGDTEAPSDASSLQKGRRRRRDEDNFRICGIPRRTWGCSMLGLLIVAAAGVGGGIWYLRSIDDEVVGPSPTGQPTFATEAPTSASQNTDLLREQLLPYIVRNDEDLLRLQNPTSPQYKTLAWLSEEDGTAFHDESKMDTTGLNTTGYYQGIPTEIWLERYVLGVLYFATAGPNWKIDLFFLDHTRSVCDWNSGTNDLWDGAKQGIYCEQRPTTNNIHDGSLGELSVTHIDLRATGLTGLLPWEITLLEALKLLILDSNFLLGSLPDSMSDLTALETLYITENSLTGDIPIDLPSSLESLDLSDNALSGTLPSEWGETLPNLSFLSLSLNSLQGSLPESWGSLSFLESFDVEGNQLTGTIPVGYGAWNSVQSFFVESNQLTGSLPSELGLLTSLQQLLVYDNVFMGTVPTEFARLVNLEFFWFQANELTGSVDEIFCGAGNPPEFLRGDCRPVPTPEIECSCCSECCLPDGTGCVRPNRR